jgi:hypothetical protein
MIDPQISLINADDPRQRGPQMSQIDADDSEDGPQMAPISMDGSDQKPENRIRKSCLNL